MEQQKETVSQMNFIAVDLLVGTCTSGIQNFVGYPLDFVKTRMQIFSNRTGGALVQFSSIIKEEGIMSLYRGITSPLLASLLSGSLYFSSYEFARRTFADFTGKTYQNFLPFYQIFLAGSFAGFCSDILNIPLDYAKIQVQKEYVRKGQFGQKSGPFTFLTKIVKEKGLLQIYKGSQICLVRDLFGCGWFFTAYDFTLRMHAPSGLRKDVSQFGVFTAAATAGIAYWTMAYPLDVLKTKFQSDDPENPKFKSIKQCAQEIYKQGGIHSFYKGYVVTVVRSILVNTVGLCVYENLHRLGYSFLE